MRFRWRSFAWAAARRLCPGPTPRFTAPELQFESAEFTTPEASACGLCGAAIHDAGQDDGSTSSSSTTPGPITASDTTAKAGTVEQVAAKVLPSGDVVPDTREPEVAIQPRIQEHTAINLDAELPEVVLRVGRSRLQLQVR